MKVMIRNNDSREDVYLDGRYKIWLFILVEFFQAAGIGVKSDNNL